MSRLEHRYTAHHQTGHRLGFTFGGRDRIRVKCKWIGTGRRILDLGCRDGTLTAAFAEGNSVIGGDIDFHALDLGRESGRLFKTVQLDAGAGLPFASGSFDTIVCGEVLEHLAFPAFLSEEAARMLAPGGLLAGSVPNAYRLKNRLTFLTDRPFDPDPTHLHFFSISGLRQLLEEKYEEIEIQPAIGRFVFLSPALFANSLIWRCRRR